MNLMKKNGMFGPKDGCEFQPQKAKEAVKQGDMDAVRKSIFGNDCGSEESVNAYITSSPSSERTMLTEFMEKVSKMIQTAQHAKETGESKEQEVDEIEAEIDEVGSSLLALDSEGALESAEGTGLVVFILLCIFWFLFFMWILED